MAYDVLELLDRLFNQTSVGERYDRAGFLPTVNGFTPAHLSIEWRVEWEERAAIRQYDGKLPRWQAETLALHDVLDTMARVGERPMREAG